MHIKRHQFSLSAPGGGEGWGDVGDSGEVAAPTSPSRALGAGPSLSPLKGGEGSLVSYEPTRRWIVLATAGAVFAPFAIPAAATQAAMEEAIRTLVGESEPRRGKVRLELPPIVENGNTVSLTVSVESPMTESNHVESIHIFNQKNPQPYVAAFNLGPRAGKASVSTRIRLADSQQVVAIARLNDGSYWSDSADVIVTLAACTEQ
jgi:sulfur-oxidizing protein SoxY